ncbi:MAG: hypothetical protein ACRDTM_16505, partial [Micromonosporaceae bacterium]
MVEQAVAAGVAERELLPAREVELRRAARLGLTGGGVAILVSANGMVQAFSEREVIGPISLGYLMLLGIALIFGYLAGRPPPVLQGFAAPRPGWRNLVGGLLAGLVAGAVMAAFVALIATVNLRSVFLNITPELARSGPRLLTLGQELGAGLGLIVGGAAALGA